MTQEASPDADGQTVTVEQAFELARKLHRQNHLDDAETLYRRLLEALPDWPDVLNLLAILRYQRGAGKEAVTLLQRAVGIDPDYADAHNNLGNVFKHLDRIDEAAAAYRRALEINPEHADAHNNLGVIHRLQGRQEDAVAAFREATRCNPRLADAFYNLGCVLTDLGRFEEAAEAMRQTLALNPYYTLAYKRLGLLLYRMDRKDEAAEVYRGWLKRTPDHPVALHMLAACTGENVPERASDHYVRTLFDLHADSFDEHLVEQLQYRAPRLVTDALTGCYGAGDSSLDILDAGCGTGLCGPLLKPYACSLVGVDLSPKMLRGAQRREVYDELAEAELSAFLNDRPDAFDLIVSADTLCYFGRLEEFSEAAARSLRPGGRLVFTVERLDASDNPGFVLTNSGRYAHREDYLRETLTTAGFAVEALDRADLRMEGGRPVAGLVVTAWRS